MAIQSTKWRPDTCDCVIIYDWDDSLDDKQRIHSLKSIEKCEVHKALDDQTAFNAVSPENVLKNVAIAEVVSQIPDVKHEEILFAFDDTRILTLIVPDIDQSEKSLAQSSVDAKVGSGKVIVE